MGVTIECSGIDFREEMVSSDGVMPHNSPQHLLGALTHP